MKEVGGGSFGGGDGGGRGGGEVELDVGEASVGGGDHGDPPVPAGGEGGVGGKVAAAVEEVFGDEAADKAAGDDAEGEAGGDAVERAGFGGGGAGGGGDDGAVGVFAEADVFPGDGEAALQGFEGGFEVAAFDDSAVAELGDELGERGDHEPEKVGLGWWM